MEHTVNDVYCYSENSTAKKKMGSGHSKTPLAKRKNGRITAMSGTLDRFLPPFQTKPKQDPKLIVQDTCAKCGKPILLTEPKYTLNIKGKEGVYHQACAKQILRPHENTEQNL